MRESRDNALLLIKTIQEYDWSPRQLALSSSWLSPQYTIVFVLFLLKESIPFLCKTLQDDKRVIYKFQSLYGPFSILINEHNQILLTSKNSTQTLINIKKKLIGFQLVKKI